ncbi:hypothetical protein NQ176_g4124 [Zarea fungicola]|uniref:Uncharacterized protein n=1 Tax=Zarea fungicola TaxID=93591 RepID=A0ACC1NGF7_9HYPO|nr:hypothetical protein NQ176_g4124 [Lecanicillium fungicola]
MRTALFSALVAFSLALTASAVEEKVIVSNLRIHKKGSNITRVQFRLDGHKVKDINCSGEKVPFPEPKEAFPCGDSGYSFVLFPGDKKDIEFQVFLYHDVGDRHADLRGGFDIHTIRDNIDAAGHANEIYTQKEPVSFTIEGPVGQEPGDSLGPEEL